MIYKLQKKEKNPIFDILLTLIYFNEKVLFQQSSRPLGLGVENVTVRV